MTPAMQRAILTLLTNIDPSATILMINSELISAQMTRPLHVTMCAMLAEYGQVTYDKSTNLLIIE